MPMLEGFPCSLLEISESSNSGSRMDVEEEKKALELVVSPHNLKTLVKAL